MKKILQLFTILVSLSAFSQGTISNISATGVTNNAATINYSANTNSLAANRRVLYQMVSSPTSVQSPNVAVNTTTATPFTTNLTGLNQNKRYVFNVILEGSGPAPQPITLSPNRFFTTTGTAAVPILSAVSVGNGTVSHNSAVFTYSVNPNGPAIATVSIVLTEGTTIIGQDFAAGSGTTTTQYNTQITGLTPNRLYTYEVFGSNSLGESISSTGQFITQLNAAPVYHWPFNGNLNSVATTGIFTTTGTPVYVDNGSGVSNSALQVNVDANSYATNKFTSNLSLLPQGNTSRTISMRINFKTAAMEHFVFEWGTPNNTQSYGFSKRQNAAISNVWGDSQGVADATVQDTWVNLVMTYNPADKRFNYYKNGIFVGGNNHYNQLTTVPNTTGTNAVIGTSLGQNFGLSNFWIDDLRIYNTVLTQAEITALNAALSNESFSKNNLKFSMFPNPANNILNIDMSNDLKSVEIYSLQGQKVFSGNEKQINIANLSSGMYMVRVQDVDGGVATQKLVKN